MPPELPNEQELTLKKRARRRLVGAVALVLLMVIVLPQILQDRALQAQQEPIKITMPDVGKSVSESIPNQHAGAVSQQQEVSQPQEPVKQELPASNSVEQTPPNSPVQQEVAVSNVEKNVVEATRQEVKAKKIEPQQVASVVENKQTVKSAVTVAEEKPVMDKPATVKTESFAVQVGVYSDAANVKRLQEQLKQAGFSTSTEKVQTSKGESLRLKAGNFKTRQDAVDALAKIKNLGLPGMVISNE